MRNTPSRKYAHLWWNGNWSKRKSVVEKTACSSARTAFAKNVHGDWPHIYALRNGGPWFIPGLCSVLNNCGNWRDCPKWINPLHWLTMRRAVFRYEDDQNLVRRWQSNKTAASTSCSLSRSPWVIVSCPFANSTYSTLYQVLSFPYPSSQQPSITWLRAYSFQTIPRGLEGALASFWGIQNCMQDEGDWTGEDCTSVACHHSNI